MMSSNNRSIDRPIAHCHARLRAQATLLVCIATLTFATFVLLGADDALAQDQQDISDVDAITAEAPKDAFGELPSVHLEEKAAPSLGAQSESPAAGTPTAVTEADTPASKGAVEAAKDATDSTTGAIVAAANKPAYKLTHPKCADTGLVYDGTRQQGYSGVPVTRIPADNGTDEMDYNGPFDVEYKGINGTVYNPPKALSAGYQQINTHAPINAGTYQVVFTVPEDQSFTLEPNRLEFSIAKAPAPALSQPSVTLFDAPGSVMAFDLARMINLPSDLNGGPVYAVTAYTANGLTTASIDSATGELTLTSKGGAGLAASDTVTVALADMGNYEDTAVQVNVSYKAKPAATISGAQSNDDTPQTTCQTAPPGNLLAHTGDTTPSGLIVAVTGVAALVAGASCALALRASRRQLRDSKRR